MIHTHIWTLYSTNTNLMYMYMYIYNENTFHHSKHTLHSLLTQSIYSPNDELLLDVFIDDEVQVPLSVPSLLILQPKVKVGQHVETRGQQSHCLGHNTQLPLLGLGWRRGWRSQPSHDTIHMYYKMCTGIYSVHVHVFICCTYMYIVHAGRTT